VVIVLTDGENDDPSGNPDRRGQADKRALLSAASARSAGSVRLFTIAYGSEADADDLQSISEPTGGRVYDARDVTKIQAVLRQAVSNT
jgi:Ca-activated chloride channel homolog